MERLVKGIHILPFADFINEHYEEDVRAAIYQRLRPDTRDMLKSLRRDEWKPMELVADIYDAIYNARSDAQTGYDDMVAAGAASADFAAGTYVRLLIKLMTPKIMVSKWPDVWRKTHNFGEMVCKLEQDRTLKMTIGDVADYSHIAPCAVGFMTFSLNAMGLKAKVEQLDRGASPRSARYEFAITW